MPPARDESQLGPEGVAAVRAVARRLGSWWVAAAARPGCRRAEPARLPVDSRAGSPAVAATARQIAAFCQRCHLTLLRPRSYNPK